MSLPTLLDIAKLNNTDPVVGLIEEAAQIHPELTMGIARSIKGLQYRTKVRTSVPSVTFRDANEGQAAIKSTFENRLVETYILNPRWEADVAVADAYEDGPEAYIALEAAGVLEGALQTLCKTFYYGTNATFGDAKGFPGLVQSYDATNMVVDAGGTTDDVASSVWAVKWGFQSCHWVLGNSAEISVDDVRKETVLDSGGSNRFTAYVQELLARPGLQVGNIKHVARIKKLTTDTGKGLTDDLMADLLELFPAGVKPDAIFMSRRSLGQLRGSRTAYDPLGRPAERPTEYDGIPLQVSDAIVNTEKLAL